ncbi:MAG: hypothetical protein R6U44_10705 [Archaeoglobaceae archaeon]
MAEKTEFVDENRDVMENYYDVLEDYYDLREKGGSGDVESLKLVEDKIWGLIEKDPDFLDPYILLYDILKEEENPQQAEELLDNAYERAVALITDKNGNWPDILEWMHLENRHIIRTILNKAILLWENEDFKNALELFRKLLKTNPGDNVGARHYILAIRMGMTFDEFEDRFDKGGYYDTELMDWFEDNYKDFPDEFGWWEEAVEELE